MIVNNSGLMSAINQSKQVQNNLISSANLGNELPPDKNNSDFVQISDMGKSKLLHKTSEFMDFTDKNGPYQLGMMALGSSSVNDWLAKGLNISDEAVIAAGQAFQDGFKKKVEESGASLADSGGLALNKHQIVINSQDVPDWFIQEYESVLSSMGNKDMMSAFEKGNLFFTAKSPSLNLNAVAGYASVVNNKQ